MKYLLRLLKNKNFITCAIFTLLCAASVFLLPLVNVNYDLKKYLPSGSSTVKGIEIYNDEFGDNGTASVMVKNISPAAAYEFKKQIEEIENVSEVLWIDDIVMPYLPAGIDIDSFINNYDTFKAALPPMVAQQLEKQYNGNALFEVTFENADYSEETKEALKNIDNLGKVYLGGSAASAYNSANVIINETMQASAIIIPIAFVILFIATKSYIDPLIFLIVTGVSVLLNLASNAILGEISYMTLATAAILQMALSMDYMIFLNNRYRQEKLSCPDKYEAMKNAVKKSFVPLCASSLTTIAGFIALMFMRYSIGLDMGIVLAKGIIISIISALTLMPCLALLFDKISEKTMHKVFEVKFKNYGKYLKYTKFVLPALFIIVIAFGGYFQNKISYLYGQGASCEGEGSRSYSDKEEITNSFGLKNPLVILIPVENRAYDAEISAQLAAKEGVDSVNSYTLTAYAMQNAGLQPDETTEKMFVGTNYYRIILNLALPEESGETFELINEIEDTLKTYTQDYYLVGSSPSVLEIKNVVDYDYTVISFISIGLIAIILFVSFKSFLLPLLLIAVIQGSIWINMAIPYILNQPLIFIGCMIVSCIQLGATIDYGILLSARYMENRKIMEKHSAVISAVNQSAHSIIISAGILFTSGLILSIVSSMPGIAIIGTLISRGTAISTILVFLLLPHLLLFFDKGIGYTTIRSQFKKDEK